MKRLLTLAASALTALGMALPLGAKKIHTIGDSTMANYNESSTDTRGWCQYLQQFLTGIDVNNRGKNGASSKSFYKEAPYWTTVKEQMEPGDIVVIQFAHNDEKTQGMDGDEVKAYYTSTGNTAAANSTDYRGTDPRTTYKEYLRKYIDETRALGCEPILAGPVCRMYFSGNTIRRSGRHDLGDSFSRLTPEGILEKQSVPASDHTMDYAESMRQVAIEKGVPYVDLTTATAELYLGYGQADCMAIISDGDGSTHLSATGAALIARRFVELCREAGLLEGYHNLSGDLTLSPAGGSLGEGYVGQTISKEFMVSGFSLTPAAGEATVSASGAVEVSADGGATWGTSATLAYTGSTLLGRFMARVNLAAEGLNSGSVTVSVPSGMTASAEVSATGITLSGGVEVKAYWRLEKNSDCELTGPAQVIEQSWHGMELQRYSAPNANTIWPEWTGYDASRKTQRNIITGNEWPAGEIDEVSTRYIEVGLTAMPETTLAIDALSFFLCGCGGNGMCVNVWYSPNDDFSDAKLIYKQTNLPANNMQYVEEKPVLRLQPGQSVRLRFYPWYSSKATGKTICLSDITIHGYATTDGSSALPVISGAGEASTTYYNLSGYPVALPSEPGIYVERTVNADGSTVSRKVRF